MRLEQFHKSIHCTSGVHCDTCRNGNADAWRLAMTGRARFDCPHGVAWDAERGETALPEVSPEDISRAITRLEICERCPAGEAISREVNGFPVYAVRCKAAGRCAKISAIRGRCPCNNW